MKTAFLSAIAATVRREWAKASVKSDKLIRRELRVNDPSDPEQGATARSPTRVVVRHPAICQAEGAVPPSEVAIVTGAFV
jgi:hypothetical protein